MLKFKSKELNLYVEQGKLADENSRKFIRNSLGVIKKKVEAKRHSILSGPPGVGKTYGTIHECRKNKVKFIVIEEGISDINLATRLAVAVHSLKKNEELVVILDDADSVVFGDYKTLNKWKVAMANANEEIGTIPMYNHPTDVKNHIISLQKQGRYEVAAAVKSFIPSDGLGLNIPMDRVRFVILCNKNYEDAKSFSGNGAAKMRAGVAPAIDRMNSKHIDANATTQWGWAAYVLGETQPFQKQGYTLTNIQKIELMSWMYANWSKLKSTSYRMVETLAAAMINDPDNYLDEWYEQLRGK